MAEQPEACNIGTTANGELKEDFGCLSVQSAHIDNSGLNLFRTGDTPFHCGCDDPCSEWFGKNEGIILTGGFIALNFCYLYYPCDDQTVFRFRVFDRMPAEDGNTCFCSFICRSFKD